MSGRSLRGVLVVALVSGAVGVLAPAADAVTTGVGGSWAGVDSREPFATVTEGRPRVGAWRDGEGKHHISRAYFTFDIARYAGTSLLGARVGVSERGVADCAKPRSTEMWWVTPSGAVTWAEQPVERLRLAGPSEPSECVGRIGWDVRPALEQALAEGRDTLTLVVRIAEQWEGDVDYGRTLVDDAWLTVDHNSTPDVPTGLTLRSGAFPMPCGDAPLLTGGGDFRMEARLSDVDGDWLTGRFAFWPTADPAARVEKTVTGPTGAFMADIPREWVRDGAEYGFAVRAEDGRAVSEWSAPCVFRTDMTAPDRAPTVASSVYTEGYNYPGSGGVGVAGEFTFTANGVTDVAGFMWGVHGVPQHSVAAVDGVATIQFTPTSDGPKYLTVVSLDAAGNRSAERQYTFWVRDTRPVIDAPRGIYGEPFAVTITATQEGAAVVHYTVDGVAGTAALVDGVATIELEIPAAPGPVLRAWTTTADGTASQVAVLDFAGPIEEW